MNKENELRKALQRFETKILLDPIGVGPTIIENLISKDIKIAYYIENISTSITYSGGPKIVLNVKYKNTNVSPNDIFAVSNNEEVCNILCQYIGNYKTNLVLFFDSKVDINAAYEKFSIVKSAFYSNYIGAQITTGYYPTISMSFCQFSFNYRIGKVKLAMMENEINNEIVKIAKQLFLPSMSNATKAFLAHNYLAHTIEYTLKKDISSLEESYMQSAYGALIKKKCVCQGYAEAFKRLMDYAKIPCDIVCGKTKGASTEHAWNIIKLNDGRDNYHIDVTWDSQEDGIYFTYFGLKDSDFMGERTWNKDFNVKCNSNTNLLLEARRGIMRFKPQLIANGVSLKILGF